jgi:hypothetical protein
MYAFYEKCRRSALLVKSAKRWHLRRRLDAWIPKVPSNCIDVQSPRQSIIKKLQVEDDEDDGIDEENIDDIELPLLPDDTFSYFAFSSMKSYAKATALTVIMVQLSTIVVLLVNMMGHPTIDWEFQREYPPLRLLFKF